MLTIQKLYNNLVRLDTDRIAFDSLDQTSDSIADLNREQLFEGKNADGEPIGEYRNELYAEMKNRMNPKPGFGVVDLRFTGGFYQGLNTNVLGDDVITESTDEKNADLQKKYGSDIFGLSKPKKVVYIADTLRPRFNQFISEFLGLKF